MKTHKKEGGNCAEVQFFCFMLRKVDAFVTIIIVCLALLAMIGEEGKMREIESAQNETLRMLRDLGRSKTRQREGLFLVEGRKMVAEAVTYARPCKVLVMKSRFPDYEEMVVNHFSDNDIILMPDTLFASFCQAKTPQGIACLVPLPEKQNLPEEAPLVFLDGVQDPGNVGTILRTAEAVGAADYVQQYPQLAAGNAQPAYSLKELVCYSCVAVFKFWFSHFYHRPSLRGGNKVPFNTKPLNKGEIFIF